MNNISDANKFQISINTNKSKMKYARHEWIQLRQYSKRWATEQIDRKSFKREASPASMAIIVQFLRILNKVNHEKKMHQTFFVEKVKIENDWEAMFDIKSCTSKKKIWH